MNLKPKIQLNKNKEQQRDPTPQQFVQDVPNPSKVLDSSYAVKRPNFKLQKKQDDLYESHDFKESTDEPDLQFNQQQQAIKKDPSSIYKQLNDKPELKPSLKKPNLKGPPLQDMNDYLLEAPQGQVKMIQLKKTNQQKEEGSQEEAIKEVISKKPFNLTQSKFPMKPVEQEQKSEQIQEEQNQNLMENGDNAIQKRPSDLSGRRTPYNMGARRVQQGKPQGNQQIEGDSIPVALILQQQAANFQGPAINLFEKFQSKNPNQNNAQQQQEQNIQEFKIRQQSQDKQETNDDQPSIPTQKLTKPKLGLKNKDGYQNQMFDKNAEQKLVSQAIIEDKKQPQKKQNDIKLNLNNNTQQPKQVQQEQQKQIQQIDDENNSSFIGQGQYYQPQIPDKSKEDMIIHKRNIGNYEEANRGINLDYQEVRQIDESDLAAKKTRLQLLKPLIQLEFESFENLLEIRPKHGYEIYVDQLKNDIIKNSADQVGNERIHADIQTEVTEAQNFGNHCPFDKEFQTKSKTQGLPTFLAQIEPVLMEILNKKDREQQDKVYEYFQIKPLEQLTREFESTFQYLNSKYQDQLLYSYYLKSKNVAWLQVSAIFKHSSTKLESIYICPYQISCFTNSQDYIVAGTNEGSVVLWEINQSSSISYNKYQEQMQVSFDCPVYMLNYTSDLSDQTDPLNREQGDANKNCAVTSIKIKPKINTIICSLMFGCVNIYRITKLNQNEKNSIYLERQIITNTILNIDHTYSFINQIVAYSTIDKKGNIWIAIGPVLKKIQLDGEVKYWQEGTGSYISYIQTYNNGAIAGYNDGTVRIYSNDSCECILQIDTSPNSIKQIKLYSNLLVILNKLQEIYYFDLSDLNEVYNKIEKANIQARRILSLKKGSIIQIQIDKQGTCEKKEEKLPVKVLQNYEIDKQN